MSGCMIEKDGRWFANTAVVCGDVTLGRSVNIWHQVVIRGDVAPISLGDRVNVQDATVIHCETGVPLIIDSDVVIGHHAVVHCRRVGRHTLVGTRSTILDGSEIGSDCVIASGAVVPPRTKTPDGVVLMGVPAKIVRDVRPEELELIDTILERYQQLSRRHAAGEFASLY